MKKEKIDQLLHFLWKEGDISYNRALQDVQIALDSMNEEQVSDKLGGINNALVQDILAMRSVDEAMAEVEKKAKAFTEAHKGESSEQLLAEMRGEEPVSEDLGEYINELSKQFPEVSFAKLSRIAVRVAKWQKEQIKEALLSEVLPCFMHGGEADEVVAKLEEVLNQNK